MAAASAAPRTMFEKIWSNHVVVDRPDGYTLLYVDRHLIHDGSYFAFQRLKNRGLKLRRPDLSFGTPDHYMPTDTRRKEDIANPNSKRMVTSLAVNGAETGVTVFDIGDRRNGIVHVVGPEQGITLPGITLVCGDSHTSTHGALGCLAFGIGQTEVIHVMATQCLWQKKPKTMRIDIDGQLGFGVSGKDVILAIIARIGAAGGTGYVFEYAGSGIRALTTLSLPQRQRLTEVVDEASAELDFLLVDTAPGVSDNVIDLAGLSDRVMVVTSYEPTAIVDAYAVIKLLMAADPDREVGVVVNAARDADQGELVFRQLSAAATRFLGVRLRYYGFILRDASVGESVLEQRPVVSRLPDAPASRCFRRLALRVANWGRRPTPRPSAPKPLAPFSPEDFERLEAPRCA